MMGSIDYFRRVPRDFTEGTSPGVLMSIMATCIMGSLFVLEVRDYLDVQVVTDVVMDDSSDFEDIQCDFTHFLLSFHGFTRFAHSFPCLSPCFLLLSRTFPYGFSLPFSFFFRINFDMLMPDLVCQFASIDVSGTNINTNFINFSWLPLYSAVFFFISELTLLDLLDFGADFC